MSSARLVSIVIPAFNAEPYIAEAIESVLADSHRPLEIIVVDDGSTDGTAAVVERFDEQVTLIAQPNRGIAAARNAGFAATQGSYLATHDADDRWVGGRLTRQLAVLDARPDIDIVYGHARQFFSPELDAEERSRLRIAKEVIAVRSVTSMLARRAAFERVGPLEEEYAVGQSLSWTLRADEIALRTVLLPDVVFERRIHRTNQGRTRRDLANLRLHALKASLDRRRAAEAHDDGTARD